jgi:phosphoglycerate dehydrogenase-like enzyme
MKIVVTSPSFSKNSLLVTELLKYFPLSTLNSEGIKLEGPKLVEYIAGADGVIVGLERLNQSTLMYCDNLKIISKYGVGLDNVDLSYCKANGIYVGWTPGVNKRSVAEMTLAFMICHMRNIYSSSLQMKQGVWNKSGGSDLSRKTIGIIGVGNVGKELIRLLKPFRCNILVNDIIGQEDYYRRNRLEEVSKDVIFRDSDIVSVHTPLTPETKYLVNKRTLSTMKPTAFLINSARGGIVKTEELKWALKNRIISGAAVDVYEDEPPTDTEFLMLPNLMCTPHIGGNSLESILSMGKKSIDHLRTFFRIRSL